MKKILSIIMICVLPLVGANAQKKDAKQYLPEQGDWAIGVNVVPLLKYIGGNDNDQFTGGNKAFHSYRAYNFSDPDVSILGKYMLTDKVAIRANLGFMFGSNTQRAYIQDDKASFENSLSEDKVVDAEHTSNNGMSLNLGLEYRKGSRRVQGVFGAGILFAFQSQKKTYDWGNEMTTINQSPTSTIFYQAHSLLEGYRQTEYKSNGNFYTGITGSVGVEWFVAPKISLGAEVNIVAYYEFGSQSYAKSEGYNTSLDKIEERTDLSSPGDRGFHFGTESLGGALNMTFYF